MKATYKTEGDVAKAARQLTHELQKTLDTLYGGLAEKSSTLASDPRIVLDRHRSTLETLLEACRASRLRLETHQLVLALCRPLSVQHGHPTRDALGRASASDLAAIHGWSFRMLALLLARAPSLSVPLSATQIKYFVCRYHLVPLLSGGAEMFLSLMEFLIVATSREALHSSLVEGCVRELVELFMSLLRQTSPTPTPTLNATVGRKKTPPTGKHEASIPTASAQVSPQTIRIGLDWLHRALSLSSFQSALTDSLRDSLVHAVLPHFACSNTALACLALKTLSAAVLGVQPARLSPHLPLLALLLSVALHHASLEVREEATCCAREIDLLIRPRRPYASGRWSPRAMSPDEEIAREDAVDRGPDQNLSRSPGMAASRRVDGPQTEATLKIIAKQEASEKETDSETTVEPSHVPVSSPAQVTSLQRTKVAFQEIKIPAKRQLDLSDLLNDDTLPQLIDEGPDVD